MDQAAASFRACHLRTGHRKNLDGLKHVFIESSVSPKTIERVIADCKSRGWDVKMGGELYSDAMGAAGAHAGYAVETYEGMVRYNVDTIVAALK